MTETERQFRAAGWSWRAESMYKWEHSKYGTIWLDTDIREPLMEMWLTGFVAGKESVSSAGEIAGSSETQDTKEGDER